MDKLHISEAGESLLLKGGIIMNGVVLPHSRKEAYHYG